MKTLKDFEERWPYMFQNVECGVYHPRGWNKHIWRLCCEIEDMNLHENVKIVQTKSKFGSMRFYYEIPDEIEDGERAQLRAAVSALEDISGKLCWFCGLFTDRNDYCLECLDSGRNVLDEATSEWYKMFRGECGTD